MIDLDLTNPINQVRVLVGDVSHELISDNNISFILDKHSGDISLATEEALSYIVNMVAYYVREESGDVEVYWGEIYERLDDLLSKVKAQNHYKKTSTLFYFGGTIKSEVKRVRENPESVGLGFYSREFLDLANTLQVDVNNPYKLT